MALLTAGADPCFGIVMWGAEGLHHSTPTETHKAVWRWVL